VRRSVRSRAWTTKKALADLSICQGLLFVAGTGFEPVTFGL
jgi:hypothetical protein